MHHFFICDLADLVKCYGTEIQSTDSVTYLGADLDCCLTGESMGNKIIKKTNARLKFLFRKAKYLNTHTRRLLASALVQCHLDYACSFWFSGLTLGTKNKLQATQNRLVRFVFDLPYRTHIGAEQFKTVGWLPVGVRVQQIKATHMYCIFNHSAPNYLSENLKLVQEIHPYVTRHNVNCYHLPSVNSYGLNSFFYTGAKIWNSLPNNTKLSQELHIFKSNVKAHLMKSISYNENMEFLYY